MSKFDTCAFKSAETHTIITSRCCGKTTQKEGAYLCFHPQVGIEDVQPEICDACNYYKEKENGENQGRETGEGRENLEPIGTSDGVFEGEGE